MSSSTSWHNATGQPIPTDVLLLSALPPVRVFEEQFDDLDEKKSDWYELIKCNPNYLVHYHDGEIVTLSTDMTLMKKEIEKWEGKDGWIRFMEFMEEVRNAAIPCLRDVHLGPGLIRCIGAPFSVPHSLRSLPQGGLASELPKHTLSAQAALRPVSTGPCFFGSAHRPF